MSANPIDTTPTSRSTLVLGASGKTGRRVADLAFAGAAETAANGVWDLERRAS